MVAFLMIMGALTLVGGLIYGGGVAENDLEEIGPLPVSLTVGGLILCGLFSILMGAHGADTKIFVDGGILENIKSLFINGYLVTGLILTGVAASLAFAGVTLSAIIIYGWGRFISDRSLKRCWGNFPPFENYSYDAGKLHSLIFNLVFYTVAIPAVFTGVAMGSGILYTLGVFSMGYILPASIIGGFIVFTFGLRTVLRLIKVVKEHVTNTKIHNEGILDVTGLADKLKDDEDVVKLLSELVKNNQIDELINKISK